MRQFLLAILFLELLSCNSTDRQSFEFPSGGYRYPQTVAKNGNKFMHYQLKDSLTKQDSFQTAYYGPFLLDALEEPNLSVKYYQEIRFRFIYDGPFEQPLVINFTENEIVIKEGVKGTIYPKSDGNRLTGLESHHLIFFRQRYPVTDSFINKGDKQYLDSILIRYPSLADVSYYWHLLKKSEVPITDQFSFKTQRIPISKAEFQEIVSTINSSGYWSFPYEMECKEMPTDVSWYSLEANLPDRYNVVFELDCNDTPFKVLCRKLMKVAKVNSRI